MNSTPQSNLLMLENLANDVFTYVRLKTETLFCLTF